MVGSIDNDSASTSVAPNPASSATFLNDDMPQISPKESRKSTQELWVNGGGLAS
jgi:hypothetical protein